MRRVQLKCNTYPALVLYFIFILSALSLPGCTPIADTRALLKEDLRPPVFLSIDVNDSCSISLEFSEAIEYRPASYSCSPALSQADIRTEEEKLHLSFQNPMQPGTEYSWSAASATSPEIPTRCWPSSSALIQTSQPFG